MTEPRVVVNDEEQWPDHRPVLAGWRPLSARPR